MSLRTLWKKQATFDAQTYVFCLWNILLQLQKNSSEEFNTETLLLLIGAISCFESRLQAENIQRKCLLANLTSLFTSLYKIKHYYEAIKCHDLIKKIK
jgi:hypothetical protein